MIALHKKGPKCLASNYRPVSLTSVLCKLYEKFIRKHILTHVEHLLSAQQHGFVGGRSCLSNMLETVEIIIDMLDGGAPVDVLYFDFCKAFDTVPHWRLLTKLGNYGITGVTLEIIRDFLSNRSMNVVVGGEKSESHRVTSGVPQGSVLGPLLFVLFINDLPDDLKSKIMLFADDLKLIANVNNYDSVKGDISQLEQWQDTWLLRFNTDKCKVLHLSKNGNPGLAYYVGGTALSSVESECDLGLYTDAQFEWTENMKRAISKANRMTAWVSRNIIAKTKDVMLLVYKTLIRPHIEYCVQVWSPSHHHYGNWAIILQLEQVQRKFTRLIDDVGMLPYGERLARLNLTTLAERRIRGDLIETYKIISGSVNYGQTMFKMSKSGYNLVSKAGVQSMKRIFFSERVIGFWNKLPVEVKLSKSAENFKVNLQNYKVKSSDIKGNFWDVSKEVINRIDTPSSLAGRSKFNQFVIDNPWYARKRGINTFNAQVA